MIYSIEFMLIYVTFFWIKMNLIILIWTLIMLILLNLINLNMETFYFSFNYNISIWLSILLIWIMLICLMMNNNLKSKIINPSLLMTFLILILFFNSKSIFLIYLTFEGSILPIMIFMLWKSKSIDRLNSLLTMLMFMLMFSLPSILFFSQNFYHINLNNLLWFNMNQYSYYSFLMISMIMVKMPVFLLHIWLPKAHGDSPIFGSMILASIMLKMAGYLALIFKPIIMFFLNDYLIYSMMNFMILMTLVLSLITLTQTDLKILIAFSSIVHMTMAFIGILMSNYISELGMYFMLLAHGLTSSCLFFFHDLFYKRIHSRSIFMIKSLNPIFKSMMPLWFLTCMSNLGFPCSLNMISEILIIMNMLLYIKMLMIMILIISMILSSIYSMYLFLVPYHGSSPSPSLNFTSNINIKEIFIVLIHLIPLFLFILKIDILI